MAACTINALQGNVPAIKLALGVAILTHRTSTPVPLFIGMTGKSNEITGTGDRSEFKLETVLESTI